MRGNTNRVANYPNSTSHNYPNMNGIGITPEGINNNAMTYEMLLDQAWIKISN